MRPASTFPRYFPTATPGRTKRLVKMNAPLMGGGGLPLSIAVRCHPSRLTASASAAGSIG